MATVELSSAAVAALDRMIVTHSLPTDTRARVRRTLEPLSRFPLIGQALGSRWGELRFVLGPWRWLIAIYWYDETSNRVVVVGFEDARSSSSVTSLR